MLLDHRKLGAVLGRSSSDKPEANFQSDLFIPILNYLHHLPSSIPPLQSTASPSIVPSTSSTTLSWQPSSPGSPTTARPPHLTHSLVEEAEDDDDFYTAPPPHSPCSEASSSSSFSFSSNPPPFSSLVFDSSVTDPNRSKVAVTQPTDSALSPSNTSLPLPLSPPPPLSPPAPPSPSFEEPSESEPSSSLVADTKASFSQEPKGEAPGKSPADDGEPPPPYTEGYSPLESFTYVMAAAGGASSIITQVQQAGGPPINTLGGTRPFRGISASHQISLEDVLVNAI